MSISTPTPTPASFEHFGLSPQMLAALSASGYTTPTPIQEKAIEPAMAGRDVLGAAQTGTGKTAAFLIPIIERLRSESGCSLILAPTRELAEQIQTWAHRLGPELKSLLIVGGVAYGPQIDGLRRNPSIIVATPGRLVDLLDRRVLTLRDLRVLVLDEADRMLDMGFKPQLDKILRSLPTERQTMLFSATLPPDLNALTRMHLKNPVRVEAGPQALPPTRAEQDVYIVGREDKANLLLSLISGYSDRVLVFTRTKHRSDRLTRVIQSAGHTAQRLHADRSQSQRREALEGFRGGRYQILIATDIAARGIDVSGIGRVINFDLPQTVEDYVHRVGRTARAESDGHASSFASPEERSQLHAIERHLGRQLARRPHATENSHPVIEHRRVNPAPRPNQSRDRRGSQQSRRRA